MSKIIFLLIAIPLLETWFLIEMGGVIGAPLTILAVIFTAVVGGNLVRRQGLDTLNKVQAGTENNTVPAEALLEGVVILFAGALLITPGFFTDAVGFLCLWPAFRKNTIRRLIAAGIMRQVQASHMGTSHSFQQPHGTQQRQQTTREQDGSVTIEGDYTRKDS